MSITELMEPKHPDFEKIYAQFQARYCTGDSEDASPEGGPCTHGTSLYHAWLNKMGLDDTKPYSTEDQFSESFGWARTLITQLKEEDGRRLYKVDACFPLSSMNRNVYTEAELIQATRMLRLVTPNLNHTDFKLPFQSEGAQYEGGVTEYLFSVAIDAVCPRGYKYVDMLEHSPDVPKEYHIVHVSIEGDCTDSEETDEGNACVGLGFTGIAFLTKKVLPGIPLTRIVPVEKIMEHISFSPSGESPMSEEKEKIETDEEPTIEDIEDVEQLPLDEINEKLDLILESVKKLDPEQEPEPEPEPVCGDCGHYVDGKCEVDDSEKDAGSECDKGSFTPKGEPTSEPEKQEAEEPEEAESGEETAPEEVEEAVEAPTKFEFVRRYKELKDEGLSAKDAWRRAGFEMVEHLQSIAKIER